MPKQIYIQFIQNTNRMIKTAKISKNDSLRLRVIELKSKFKKGSDYTNIYEYEFGSQSEKQKAKIRAVWNLREVDETITKNLETLAKGFK